MKRLSLVAVAGLSLLTTSCASTVQSNWSCPIEKGGVCQSTREIDDGALAHGPKHVVKADVAISGAVAARLWGQGGWTAGEVASAPIREPDPVLAVAIAPWVDFGGDYHAGGRVLAVMRRGSWYLSPKPVPTVNIAPKPSADIAPSPASAGVASVDLNATNTPKADPPAGDLFQPVPLSAPPPAAPTGDAAAPVGPKPPGAAVQSLPLPSVGVKPSEQGAAAPPAKRSLLASLSVFLGRVIGLQAAQDSSMSAANEHVQRNLTDPSRVRTPSFDLAGSEAVSDDGEAPAYRWTFKPSRESSERGVNASSRSEGSAAEFGTQPMSPV